MHIALTADPELPVPPKLYGGIERIVDMLACGLTDAGHEVTVFAHPESTTAGRLIGWPGRNSRSLSDTARNAAVLTREVAQNSFDLVHSFSRIAYMAPILPFRLPKLMSYQRAISRRAVRLGHVLSGGTLEFSAISNWMIEYVSDVGRWHMIPNGVSLGVYTFVPTVIADAPFVFLGRIEEIKGPHLAIEIAKSANIPLVIAGNVPTEHQAWFSRHIAPHIDGKQIRFVGPVDDAQKNLLLGNARGLLMPILWDEPFGIVMAEAMACGTPVLALRRGAASEVVDDGITGFLADSSAELAAKIVCLESIERLACRRRVERLYSADAVVNGYLSVYQRMTRSRK